MGTQLNIGSVSLSNTKRLLTGCLHAHSFMREEWGLPMFSYFVCVLLLVRDSELATHPYSSDMDTYQLTANSSIAALFPADMSSK